jgi:hypothetical protein
VVNVQDDNEIDELKIGNSDAIIRITILDPRQACHQVRQELAKH